MVSELKPQSILDLAMTLALIRPGKRHLINKCKTMGFGSIASEIWTDAADGSYIFKHSHAISYAMLVYVHANLITTQDAVMGLFENSQ